MSNIRLTAVALQLIERYEAKECLKNTLPRVVANKMFFDTTAAATSAEMSRRVIGTHNLSGSSFMRCQLDYTRNQ